MASCKDCIHYSVCGYVEFQDLECNQFKPTADVVEVIRCGKCKDFESHGNGKAGICRNKKLKLCLRYATDFCSCGERRDT